MAANWSRRKYTKEEFREAWNSSLSIAEVARKLNCNKTGGGYHTLKSAAKELGLTTEHMTGQAWNKGRKLGPNVASRTPIEELLVEGRHCSSNHLKKRLWEEGLLPRHCQMDGCGISEWLGAPAPLELDHINGIHDDNRIENLRILCRNCHGQTVTFGRRNRAGVMGTGIPHLLKINGRAERPNVGSTPTTRTNYCQCGKQIAQSSKRCRDCEYKSRAGRKGKTKIDWPSRDIVLKMVEEMGYLQTGKALGVSDNAVRKFLQRA
jgi:hypothetical protein